MERGTFWGTLQYKLTYLSSGKILQNCFVSTCRQNGGCPGKEENSPMCILGYIRGGM